MVQRRSEGKKSGRVLCTDALTNCIRLRGNLAATLYCSLPVLVKSTFICFSVQLGKKTFSLSRVIHNVCIRLIMDTFS